MRECDADALAAALLGVAAGVARAAGERHLCGRCGCLLLALEPCPRCVPLAWQRPRRAWRVKPGGVHVLEVPEEERASAEQSARQLRAYRSRNFARTA